MKYFYEKNDVNFLNFCYEPRSASSGFIPVHLILYKCDLSLSELWYSEASSKMEEPENYTQPSMGLNELQEETFAQRYVNAIKQSQV